MTANVMWASRVQRAWLAYRRSIGTVASTLSPSQTGHLRCSSGPLPCRYGRPVFPRMTATNSVWPFSPPASFNARPPKSTSLRLPPMGPLFEGTPSGLALGDVRIDLDCLNLWA